MKDANNLETMQRKQDHLRVCLEENVEAGSAWWEDVTLIHNSLPEMDFNEIDTSVEFLGKKLRLPLMIAAITGGTAEAKEINRKLAAVAEKTGIGFGVGSQRAMIENAGLTETYSVRKVAPTAFIAGNIGLAQLKKFSIKRVNDAAKAIGADAMAVHPNGG